MAGGIDHNEVVSALEIGNRVNEDYTLLGFIFRRGMIEDIIEPMMKGRRDPDLCAWPKHGDSR